MASRTKTIRDDRDFDEMADQLYAVRPDGFAAARDDIIKQAREAGRPELARKLAKLRRPTQSAWLMNLLWRDQREVIEKLFELADDLTRAQTRAAGADLQRLTAQRRDLETALIQRARSLAEGAGITVNAAMEREALETLTAAMARPDVADLVRTGRLLKPETYAGFGTMVVTSALPKEGRPADAPGSGPAPSREAGKGDEGADDAKAAERLRQARAALEEASLALVASERRLADAEEHERDLRAELERLDLRRRELREQLTSAERSTRDAERGHERAQRAREAAERDLSRAGKR